MPDFALLPQPRRVERLASAYSLQPDCLILLAGPAPQQLRFAAHRFRQMLYKCGNLQWELVASAATPLEQIGLILRVAPGRVTRPQGYELTIEPDRITLEAHDEAGVFYGVCTLNQILQIYAPAVWPRSAQGHGLPDLSEIKFDLPGLRIVDWPDFPARGVMLDISRDKVPTLETTKALIDRLASWKINQFQLYTEHTFAYRRHPEVWATASPFTGEEILELDAFCRERFVELVPNQNSFGHMQRWLKLPRYASLAEAPDGFDFPWGDHSAEPFSLCPIDPGSLELVTGLFDELLPHFTSRMFNVGCDETFDLGQGRSRAECDRAGTGRVYLDYLLKVYQAVKARDHVMQFWGDIIVQYPELIAHLPQDAIALEWGYEAQHPFSEHGAQFAQAGLPFYVCPGTSSWNTIAGRTANAVGNLQSAAENGLKHGAVGYLNTDWGDNGHWQTLPISYLGFAMGAASSWAYEANREADVPRVVSQFAFDDPTGRLGRVAYDLGNVYQATGIEPHNSSTLFWMLQWPLAQVADGYRDTVSPETLHQTLAAIDEAMAPLAEANSARPDAALVRTEFELTARMLRHAAQRGLYAIGAPVLSGRDLARMLRHAAQHGLYAIDAPALSAHDLDRDLREIMIEYEWLWGQRNRPGGLSDSIARLERSRRDYAV